MVEAASLTSPAAARERDYLPLPTHDAARGIVRSHARAALRQELGDGIGGCLLQVAVVTCGEPVRRVCYYSGESSMNEGATGLMALMCASRAASLWVPCCQLAQGGCCVQSAHSPMGLSQGQGCEFRCQGAEFHAPQ